MSLNEKNIFLLDGVGALLSALFTGLLLPLFSASLGLPVEVLQSLALLPLCYSAYSFCCYGLVKKIKAWMLMLIILANLSYCFVSAAVILKTDSISFWGKFLLLAEILVVIAVVVLEIKIYKKESPF